MRRAFLLLTFWCALASTTLAQYDKPEQPAGTSQAAKPDFSTAPATSIITPRCTVTNNSAGPIWY